MAYWLDEGWHRWPEIMRIGTAAAGLYARCGSYIADCETDGFIESAVARMYGTPEWIQKLVEVGLWQVEEHGFRDTRYFPLNATKAEIDKRKADAAARQRRHRGATRQSRVTPASHHASVTLPPSPPPSGGRAGVRGKPRAVPDWCRKCHPDTRMFVAEDDSYTPCQDCHPNREAS
jgi:hypothetical protein